MVSATKAVPETRKVLNVESDIWIAPQSPRPSGLHQFEGLSPPVRETVDEPCASISFGDQDESGVHGWRGAGAIRHVIGIDGENQGSAAARDHIARKGGGRV